MTSGNEITNYRDLKLNALPDGQIRTILTEGETLLERIASPIEMIDSEMLQAIADLGETLRNFRERSGFGRAIAAPQIGFGRRLIVMNLGNGVIPLLNPIITWRSPETQRVLDDCLSVPDKLVWVERALSIDFSFQNLELEKVQWKGLPPDLSELLQHETDHLDGILMTLRTKEPPLPPNARNQNIS